MTLFAAKEDLFDMKVVNIITCPFTYLGRHSYGVYLFHFVIIRSIAQVYVVQDPMSYLLWFILLLLITVLSLVIGNAIEKVAIFVVGLLNKHIFAKATLQ